jgi:hypothetical protein
MSPLKAITYLVTKVKIISAMLNTPTSARREQLKVRIDKDNITIIKSESEHETFALADLEYVILTYSGYIESMDLLLGFPNERLVQISQENPRWMDLIKALDQSGKIGQPATHWLLEFMCKGLNAPPINLMKEYPPQSNQPSAQISMS